MANGRMAFAGDGADELDEWVAAELEGTRADIAVLKLRCQQKASILARLTGESETQRRAGEEAERQSAVKEAARTYALANGVRWDIERDRPASAHEWFRLSRCDLYTWSWDDGEDARQESTTALDQLRKRTARLNAEIAMERRRAAARPYELHMRNDTAKSFQVPVDGTDIEAKARGGSSDSSHTHHGRLVWASHCLYANLARSVRDAKEGRRKVEGLELALAARTADIREAEEQTRALWKQLDRLDRLLRSKNTGIGLARLILDEVQGSVNGLEKEVSALTKELIGLIDKVWLGPRALALRQSQSKRRKGRATAAAAKDGMSEDDNDDDDDKENEMASSLTREEEIAARDDARRTKQVLEKLMNRSFLSPTDPWISTFTPSQAHDPAVDALRRRQEKEGRTVVTLSERVRGLLVRSGVVAEKEDEPNLIKLEAFAEG